MLAAVFFSPKKIVESFMPKSPPSLNRALRDEYQQLFDTCQIKHDKLNFVDDTVKKIAVNQARYESVGNPLNIPWYFIALIHNMECSLDFTRHLHNGDPLSQRTVHVPAGRPEAGNPPFDWTVSATDALKYERINLRTDWSLPAMLYFMEGYNGFGYRNYHPDVKSPYLWSYSDKYVKGKYGADGKWNPELVSKQCGVAVILKRMQEKNLVKFDSTEVPSPDTLTNLNIPLPKSGKANVDQLNIRADAGVNFEKVAVPLSIGKEVEILEEKNEWYKVRTSIEGWVSKKFISSQ